MDDTSTSTGDVESGAPGGSVGRVRWVAALLVRVTVLAAAALLLQMSGSAAWDAHALDVRGEPRPAVVLDLTRTSWGKADRVTLAVAGVGPSVRVTTPRKELAVGDSVEVIVDRGDPRVAALVGDGWPWREVLLPLCALPIVALFGTRYGRWRPSEERRGPT